jgi:hypothetical protein
VRRRSAVLTRVAAGCGAPTVRLFPAIVRPSSKARRGPLPVLGGGGGAPPRFGLSLELGSTTAAAGGDAGRRLRRNKRQRSQSGPTRAARFVADRYAR